MSYGVKIFTKYGFLSIDGEHKNLRLLDSGRKTLVASNGSAPSIVDVNFKGTSLDPITTLVCTDSSRLVGFYATVQANKDANNHYYILRIFNSDTATVDVFWRVFAYL